MSEQWRCDFDWTLRLARAAGHARNQEQRRIVDKIELLLYEAKGEEAVKVLTDLARHILDPE